MLSSSIGRRREVAYLYKCYRENTLTGTKVDPITFVAGLVAGFRRSLATMTTIEAEAYIDDVIRAVME